MALRSRVRLQLRGLRIRHLVLVSVSLCGLACSKAEGRRPVYSALGQVLFKGQPTPDALVILHPMGDADPQVPKPRGRVGNDGTFTLTTYDANDGAPMGQYAVTIIWRKKDLEGEEVEESNLLPHRYSIPQKSGLRCEIKEGPNVLDPFEVE